MIKFEGLHKKCNSASGILPINRVTAQAFIHFSYEMSNHNILIVDLQGGYYESVGDIYVGIIVHLYLLLLLIYFLDPQIYTPDGKGYGVGNLGAAGIQRFLKTHTCTAICQMV